MSTVNGGDILVRCLNAEGVDSIFAISDISYSRVFESAKEHGIDVVGGRHESANVHMADGWARATGDMAVAMGGMGPGVANMVPGVINAKIEGIPLLIVATQRNHRAHHSIRRGKFQYTPQLETFKPVTKLAKAVPDVNRIDEYVREAFRQAWNGRPGPVYLQISDDIIRNEIDEKEFEVIEPSRYRTSVTTPDIKDLETAAQMIAEADFPLIFAGSGIEWSGAWNQLQELVEYTGSTAVTTTGARGIISEDHPQLVDHPLLVMFGSDGSERAIQKADMVFAIGTQIGELYRYGKYPYWGENQSWIHLDVDSNSIGVNRPVDLPLVGDAKKSIDALLTVIKEEQEPRDLPGPAADAVRECRRIRDDVSSNVTTEPGDPIHPGHLTREVADFVPEEAIVVFDGGNTALWAHFFFTFKRPRSLLWTSHFGHLGTGLPYAISAKLARPDRPVFLYTGDSAFGFNLQELETASRENLDLVVIINCDYAWGMEHLGMEAEIGETIGVETSSVDYCEVARGLGCHGETVEDPGEIKPALRRAVEADGPALLQGLVDSDENIQPPGLLEFADMYAARDV